MKWWLDDWTSSHLNSYEDKKTNLTVYQELKIRANRIMHASYE